MNVFRVAVVHGSLCMCMINSSSQVRYAGDVPRVDDLHGNLFVFMVNSNSTTIVGVILGIRTGVEYEEYTSELQGIC